MYVYVCMYVYVYVCMYVYVCCEFPLVYLDFPGFSHLLLSSASRLTTSRFLEPSCGSASS